MKLSYDPETDSLYIDLNARPCLDSREIHDGSRRLRSGHLSGGRPSLPNGREGQVGALRKGLALAPHPSPFFFHLVGIDNQHASQILDLATLETESLPCALRTPAPRPRPRGGDLQVAGFCFCRRSGHLQVGGLRLLVPEQT